MRKKKKNLLIFMFLIIVAILMLLPFVWLILSSFRENMDLLSNPFGIPKNLSINNYIDVFRRQPMLRYLANTCVVAAIAVLLDVLVSMLTGYAMLHRFRFRKTLSVMFYIGLFIPANAFMVPY